jgi:hypothetical protein
MPSVRAGHRGSQPKAGAVFVAVVAICVTSVFPLAGPAWARVVKPRITSFTASPKTVATTDGTVVLSATVTNATSCTLFSKHAVTGLPVATSCSSGGVSQSVVMPFHRGPMGKMITVYLTASSPSGSQTRRVIVMILGGAGG